MARLRILYVVYWGLLEPLGQSLVLPPMRRFAGEGLDVTLVTFEKQGDLAHPERLRTAEEQLAAAGVRWIPLRYHPSARATAWDILHGSARSVTDQLRRPPDLVHGRTFVGGVIGSIVSRVLRRPFVFHNEGFWPDEQVESGKWPRGCLPYRITKRIELGMYRRAEGVITLSTRARDRVLPLRPKGRSAATVIVPSCVDLDHFHAVPSVGQPDGAIGLVYVGSLGGRYRISEMARFLKVARRELGEVRLTIYSHSSEEMIRREMARHGVDDSWWSLGFVPHAEMPAALSAHHAGVVFQVTGLSSESGSPTKTGEYWACGLPVVTTPRTGDVDEIIERERVGVIVPSDTDEACVRAARELGQLLADPELPARCRAAAERHYSLESGVERQLELYASLTGDHARLRHGS